VGSDFNEQPLAFVTTADLFNGFGANFVHLPSPAKIVALKKRAGVRGCERAGGKSRTLARSHACTLTHLHP
jgi:hypothetical protein